MYITYSNAFISSEIKPSIYKLLGQKSENQLEYWYGHCDQGGGEGDAPKNISDLTYFSPWPKSYDGPCLCTGLNDPALLGFK